jgi:6,7-dimethyl-8-ribityllumazine synthase
VPPRTITGSLNGDSLRLAIVVARFNELITERLLSGALQACQAAGVSASAITVAWVPGAMELPLAAQAFAQQGQVDAVIALGCVIQGSTDHYDYVCAETAKGISHTSLSTGIPVLFGVLTTQNIEQALERAGTKAGNKGADAALAAIQLVSVLRQIKAPSP